MSVPVVFASRFRIVEGGRRRFEDAFSSAVEAIERDKPRTALFAAYLDASASTVEIVHAFPDAHAMATHFKGSDERAQAVAEVLRPAGFAVYGPAPMEAIGQLRREAGATGSTLDLFVEPLAGFLRAPA